MIIKFRASSLSSEKLISYLLEGKNGERDKEKVEIIEGDKEFIKKMSDVFCKNYLRKGFHYVISFKESYKELLKKYGKEKIMQIYDEVKKLILYPYNTEDLCIFSVAHSDTDNFHIHMYVLNTLPAANKSLYIPLTKGHLDGELLKRIGEYISLKYDLAYSKRKYDLDLEKIFEKNPHQKISKRILIREKIYEFIKKLIRNGEIKKREDIKKVLEKVGIKVNRFSKKYISIEYKNLKVRLKGGIYSEDDFEVIKNQILYEKDDYLTKEKEEQLKKEFLTLLSKKKNLIEKKYDKEIKNNLVKFQEYIPSEGERIIMKEEKKVSREEVRKKIKEYQKRYLEAFLKLLGFDKEDKVYLMFINHGKNDSEKKVIQKIIKVSKLYEDSFLRYLKYLNANGYSIYMSINKLKKEAVRRRIQDFEQYQNKIFLDVDSKKMNEEELLRKISDYLKKNGLPGPSLIVKTSEGNYQFYWVLNENIKYDILESIMKKMEQDLGLDATHDLARVFRLPGFRNKKPGKENLVVIVPSAGPIESSMKSYDFSVFEPFYKKIIDNNLLKIESKGPSLSSSSSSSSSSCVNKREENLKEKRNIENKNKENLKEYWKKYYLLFVEVIDEIVKDEKKKKELKEIMLRSIKKHIYDSYSEVDMSFCYHFLKKYYYKKSMLKKIMTKLTLLRGKRNDLLKAEEYVSRTIDLVKKKIKMEKKKKEINIDFDLK